MKTTQIALAWLCCLTVHATKPIVLSFDTASTTFKEAVWAFDKAPADTSALWKETNFGQHIARKTAWDFAKDGGTDVEEDMRGFAIDAIGLFTSYNSGSAYAQPQNGIFGPLNKRLQVYISDNMQQTSATTFLVYGTTKRGDQLHDFSGSITIEHIYKKQQKDHNPNGTDTTTYALIASYRLEEDPEADGSGTFSGTFVAEVTANVSYDFLNNRLNRDIWVRNSEGDSYSNRNFVGTWTSHNTNETLKAIWGDNRLPYPLDFYIGKNSKLNPKYIDSDWMDYQHPNKEKVAIKDEEGNVTGIRMRYEWWSR